MLNTISILQVHCTQILDSVFISMFNLVAFQIATGWARKRYGDKITGKTLQNTQDILFACHAQGQLFHSRHKLIHLPDPDPFSSPVQQCKSLCTIFNEAVISADHILSCS